MNRVVPSMPPIVTLAGGSGTAMEALASPPSRANIVNNICRNYGHEWLYDFEEIVRLARRAAADRGRVGVRGARRGAAARALPLGRRADAAP